MRSLRDLALAATFCSALACDPEGAGARGTVTLGAGVDPRAFSILAIRIFPDGNADFDPKTLPMVAEFFHRLNEPLAPVGHFGPLPPLAFPYRYSLGDVVGTTPHENWRMVAWLSRQRTPEAIEAGDVFCTARFKVDGCALAGGYCGKTGGVDCTLDRIAP